MIENIKTTDNKGNFYNKIRLVGKDNGNAVVCINGTNKHYRGQPNISIREGQSTFGKEVVIQLDISELISEYPSSSGLNKHIEIYFKDNDAKELFESLSKFIGIKLEDKNGKYKKNVCHMCGEGHLFCEKCKSYTWVKEEDI